MTAKIHPTAIVSEKASLGKNVAVGPYAVIGPDVAVGDDTVIANHVTIEGKTKVGRHCYFHSGSCIGMPPQIKDPQKAESSFLEIGDENVFREYVTVNSGTDKKHGTRLGSGNYLMAYSHVAHDCRLGNDIIMANSVALGGHVSIEDQAVIGGLAGVHQFTRIGRLAMVGGLSKVTTDIPPFSLYNGNPLKFHGANSIGLKRAGIPVKQISQIKKALKLLLSSGLNISNAVKQIKSECDSGKEIDHLIDFVLNAKRGISRSP